MANYNRLSLYEREEIALSLAQGCSFREIARRLDRLPSTVSRELGRNYQPCDRDYHASLAHRRAARRWGRCRTRRLDDHPGCGVGCFAGLADTGRPSRLPED